jgi:hypothetical protein
MSEAKKHTHPLRKPIKAHGEEVKELELDEPDANLVMELGYPYLVLQNGGEGALQLQPKVAARYISRLAKVPLSSVGQLAIPDLHELQAWVMGFFGDEPAET